MTKWSGLHHIALGRIAECYAEIEFLKRGYEVYSTEADNVGVDFVAISKDKTVYKIQVKACRNDNYQFIKKKYFYKDEDFFVFYIRFVEDQNPELFLIPTTAWDGKSGAFVYRAYDNGQKSEPEYGINYSEKNREHFSKYNVDRMFEQLAL